MKIQYASDLHLEFVSNRVYLEQFPLVPRADILVLAGDICYLTEEYFQLPFFDYVSMHWEMVYIIAGNHEFYRHNFDVKRVVPTFRKKIRPNVEFLNNQSLEVDSTRLLFTTLWTAVKNKEHLAARMNDFQICTYDGRKFTVEDHNRCHSLSMKFLKEALQKETSTSRTIIVSHHVPFSASYCDYPFQSTLSEGFHVDMSVLTKKHPIDYWIYGHNHFNQLPLEIDGITFLTNQLGYVDQKEHTNFKLDAVLEFDTNKS